MEFNIHHQESDYTKWVKENGKFLKRFIEEYLMDQNDFKFEIKLPKDSELVERDKLDDFKKFASEISATYKNQPLDLIINQGNVVFYNKYRYISNNGYNVEDISLVKPVNGVDMVFNFSFKYDKNSKELLLLDFKFDGELTDNLEDLECDNEVYTFNEFTKKFK